MLIAIHGVKFYGHSYAWSEALRLLLYIECSFMLIAIHGLKLTLIVVHELMHFAHCHTWCKASCSILYMD